MSLLIFSLLVVGVVYIVTQSAIFHLPRVWIADRHVMLEMLIYCPACTGFWVGVVLSLLGYGNLSWLEGGIVACAIGALWGVYGPGNIWQQERVHVDAQEEEDGE